MAIGVHGVLKPSNRAFDFAVSRTGQARWLTAAFRLANSVNYVAGMGWFTTWLTELRLPGTGPDQWPADVKACSPKPAFYAYEHAP